MCGLNDMNRAKIQFVTTGIVANQYNALQLTILNRSEGAGGYPAAFAFRICSGQKMTCIIPTSETAWSRTFGMTMER